MPKHTIDSALDNALETGRFVYWIDEAEHRQGVGYRVSVVCENVSGHYPTGGGDTAPWYWGPSLEQAKATARAMNAKRGIDEEDEAFIICSSMRKN